MRVFITGASGWIGSSVVSELVRTGNEVVGLARSDSAAARVAALGAEVVRGDLDDLGSLRIGAESADGVVHLGYNHDFSQMGAAADTDLQAINAIGTVLEGSNRPLVIASGTLGLAPGRVGTENDQPGRRRSPADRQRPSGAVPGGSRSAFGGRPVRPDRSRSRGSRLRGHSGGHRTREGCLRLRRRRRQPLACRPPPRRRKPGQSCRARRSGGLGAPCHGRRGHPDPNHRRSDRPWAGHSGRLGGRPQTPPSTSAGWDVFSGRTPLPRMPSPANCWAGSRRIPDSSPTSTRATTSRSSATLRCRDPRSDKQLRPVRTSRARDPRPNRR